VFPPKQVTICKLIFLMFFSSFKRLFYSARAFIATSFNQVRSMSSANVVAKSQTAMLQQNNRRKLKILRMNVTLTVCI